MHSLPAAIVLLAVAAHSAIPQAQAAQAPSEASGQAKTRSKTPVAIMRSGPEPGRRAPDFTLPWATRDGVGPTEASYQLWGDLGKTVVLVFFPRAFTKSSTTEMRMLTEQYDTLFGPNVIVVGISTDPPDTQHRFAADIGLPFRLLTDEGQQVAKKYGTHGSDGFIRRSVYVIGPDGKVKYRNMRFDPFNAKAYATLGKAVQSSN